MRVKRQRRTGFSWPPSLPQVASFLCILLQSASYYGLILPAFPPPFDVLVTSVYTFLLASVILSWFLTSIIDPSDPGVCLPRPTFQREEASAKKMCVFCHAWVDPSAKHCWDCNRCTADFDHHCQWVNNCVGGKNYRWFFGTVVALQALELVIASGGIAVAVEVFTGEAEGKAMLDRYQLNDNGISYEVGLIVSGLLAIVIFAFNGFLLCFHIFLHQRSLSTHDFILLSRRRTPKISPSKYLPNAANSPRSPEKANKSYEHTSQETVSYDGVKVAPAQTVPEAQRIAGDAVCAKGKARTENFSGEMQVIGSD